MPQLDGVTTKTSEKAWTSPDGQRTIYKISLDYKGQTLPAQTYSDVIAEIGWTGDVETYERPGKFGPQTFVKQPPKEQATTGYTGGGHTSGKGPKNQDQFTMYLSYAKDLVVAKINNGDKMSLEDAIQLTLGGGHQLYEGRPGATPPEEAPKDEVVDPAQVTIDDIEKVFEAKEDPSWSKS